jgi:hypothetical protein
MQKFNSKLRLSLAGDGKTTIVRNHSDGNGGIKCVSYRFDSTAARWAEVEPIQPARAATKSKQKPKPAVCEKPKNKVLEAFRAEFGIGPGSVRYCECGPSPTMADFDRAMREVARVQTEQNELAAIAKLPFERRYEARLERNIRALQKS